MNSISLLELTNRIEATIRLNFQKPVWIRAEIHEFREHSGHCYMELIEKSDNSDTILAKCKATCWASTYRMLKPYFETTTGQNIRAGLQVLIAVTVEFHGVYGFNLNVRDIDPVFTVGEMAARRLQIIRQLEADGIADMNKQLSIPVPAQRIAIISSPTAAGYGDFNNQLKNNPYGYVFYTRLFPAIMQGEKTESSVISALEQIFEHHELYDVVVIIRGGGATTDLASFDSYQLALNCAQFPLPIIAGIGHQRDTSILDMVAHSSVKTPTAAAEFLIANLYQAENQALQIMSGIEDLVKNRLHQELRKIDNIMSEVGHTILYATANKRSFLEQQKYRLQSDIRTLLLKQKNKLALIEKNIETHSPSFMLERGYTITTVNGKRLSTITEIHKTDKIKTYLADGYFESDVTEKHPL